MVLRTILIFSTSNTHAPHALNTQCIGVFVSYMYVYHHELVYRGLYAGITCMEKHGHPYIKNELYTYIIDCNTGSLIQNDKMVVRYTYMEKI